MGAPRALVVAGYTLFAQGLAEILRQEGVLVVGVVTDAASGRRALWELKPDVVVVEREMIGYFAEDSSRLDSLIISVNKFDNSTWVLRDGRRHETGDLIDALHDAREMSGGC